MMKLEERKAAFVALGKFLSQFSRKGIQQKTKGAQETVFFEAFKMQINRSKEHNAWFTKDNVLFAIENWSKALTEENLDQWLKPYHFDNHFSKTVAVIMAGNIPLVGFHDFLSVLISGHRILVKLSSNDKYFLPLITKYLEYYNPKFKEIVTFGEKELDGFKAVIATGSNNTARYFDYYFKQYPHIIRHSRNAVAVLSGKESDLALERMTDDIFHYFGLGCRSISKVFIPKDYDLDNIFKAVFKHKGLLQYDRYKNNYDYNKAIYLMSLFDIRENGFLLLKEDAGYASPIATLFYEYYDNTTSLEAKLTADADKIQCISSELDIPGSIGLGKAQTPKLWDYADGIDTLDFLLKI